MFVNFIKQELQKLMGKKIKKIKNSDKKFDNKLLYLFMTLTILIIVAGSYTLGVYAVQQTNSGGGTHNYNEVGIPSCKNGKVLVWSGSSQTGEWICGDLPADTDYCSGGVCPDRPAGKNIIAKSGTADLGSANCIRIPHTPNYDLSDTIENLRIIADGDPWQTKVGGIIKPYTPPSDANYVKCTYNVGSLSCGSNFHDICRFYKTGVDITVPY